MIVASIPITFKSGRAADLLGHMTETGREYEFIPDITLPEGCSAAIEIVKPDGMFIISECSISSGNIIVTLPAQALVVRGLAHYIIRITTADDKIVFSAAGSIWVDDALITNELLESISEVYGLVFPDDFVTQLDLADYAKKSEVPQIEANPAGAADYDLNKLKLNNVIYKIPDAAVTKTATGNPIEISDAANAPLVKCVTQITGYQSGTGAPSPENIRPIVAYTEGEIEVRGKNLVDISTNVNGYYIAADGSVVAESAFNYTQAISVDEGTTYILQAISGNASPTNRRIHGYDKDGNWVQIIDVISGAISINASYTKSITISSGIKYVRYSYVAADFNVQLEKGSTPTIYEPYSSTTHTTTYPSAIYRGSEDVLKGEVTSESGELTENDFSSVQGTTSGGLHYVELTNLNSKADGFCLCNMAEKDNPGAWESTVPVVQNQVEGKIRFYGDFSTLSEFQTKFAGLQIVYEYKTPTTSSVTPTNLPIKSLSGYSHIESSTGEMEIEYITAAFEPLIGMHYYSSAEQVIGRWIDSSVIYEKTISFTAPSNNYVTVTTDIINFDKCISYSGIIMLSNGIFEDINYNRPDSSNSTYYTAITPDGSIFFKTYEATAGTVYITMQYTKEV